MAHQLLAAVWDQLGRRDISSILREIVGQHASELAQVPFDDDRISNIAPLMRAVSWIRVIFDLQRTYLQGLPGVERCDPALTPYLLPSEIVYSTLLYLIHVKTRLFPHPSTAIREISKHRCYIAQTLLSGVRVMLLRREYLSPEKKYTVERALAAAWQHGRLSDVEAYLVHDLLPDALDQIPSAESSDQPPTLPEVVRNAIPSFLSGLYPLNVDPDHFVPKSLADLNAQSRNCIVSFWVLYDLLWAVEAALIQCQLDRRRQTVDSMYTNSLGFKLEDALVQTDETRTLLTESIFRTPIPSPSANIGSILEILSTTLVEPLWHSKAADRSFADSKTQFRDSLTQFLLWLSNRSIQLWDCNRELERATFEFQRTIKDWLQRAAPGHPSYDRPGEPSEHNNPIYILNCPALHPVSKLLLEERMSEWSHEMPNVNAPYLTLDIYCPFCPGKTRVQHARMIEPLDHLSTALLERLDGDDTSSRYSMRLPSSSDTTSRSGTLSHSTSRSSTQVESVAETIPPLFGVLSSPTPMSAIAEQPPTPLSEQISTPSLDSPLPIMPDISVTREMKHPARDVKTRPSISRKAISFKPKSSKDVPLPRKPRFAFSSTGTSLMFWGENSTHMVRYDLSDIQTGAFRTDRYDIEGIEFAAGGDQRCAIVAFDGSARRLVTFEGNDTAPTAYVTVEAVRRGFPELCLAISHDDKYAALAINDQVQVYRIDLGNIRRVILPEQMQSYQPPPHLLRSALPGAIQLQNPSKKALTWKQAAQEQQAQRQGVLVERKLSFSPDSRKLVVATHLGDNHVYIDVWDCTQEPFKTSNDYSRCFKLPLWATNDGDITCIFYDSLHRSALLTAFLNKEYPNLIAIPGYDDPVCETYGTKVVHAAQSPSGSRFVIANGMTEFYIFDYKPNGTLSPRRIKKAASKMHSSTFKPGQLALAMPHETMVLGFWVKDQKLTLRVFRVGDGETFHDFDLRAGYDSAIREKPQSADTAFEFRRPSLPAGTAVLELPTPSIIAEMPAFRNVSELPTRTNSMAYPPEKR